MVSLLALLAACEDAPAPIANGCASCHTTPVAGVHGAFACTTCHHGDAAATEAATAHVGLEREPGALDTVDGTCGTCHADAVARVRTLPMTTGRGIVGVDRFVFGETPTPDATQTMADVLATASPTPAEDHLRRLCAGCHLGARRDNRDDAVTGGSGCAACHAGPVAGGHPTIDRAPADDRCFGCHSRSSRVSLTYAGLAEGACDDTPGPTLVDGRATCRVEPDVHHAAGLACVDCHVHTETMGDGVSRAHQDEQVEVRCESCHGAGPSARWADVSDAVSRRLAPSLGDDTLVRTGARGTPLWNVGERGGRRVLVGKADGREHGVTVVGDDHAGPGHARVSCAACHAAVAPTCGSCHTAYDPDGEQWDFGRAAVAPGKWVETGVAGVMAPPALGVDAAGRIRPAIPGMVATIALDPPRQVRRFALTDPHSTRKKARTCVECHASASALGLGSGTLDLATFRFTPTGPAAGGQAAGGWTTLGATTPGEGTRVGARSLDAAEQRRILRVGVCLGCHEAGDEAVGGDVGAARARRLAAGSTCEGPRGWWDEG